MSNTESDESGKTGQKGWVLESPWLNPFTVLQREPGTTFVAHKGHVYPERFEATWRRDDGLEVALQVRVDPAEGPIPLSVTIRHPDGVSEHRQPIPSMVRQAAAQIAFVKNGPGSISPAPEGAIPMARRVKRTNRDRLEQIAELYREAVESGEPVGEYVARREFVTKKTAYGLIGRARKAGLIELAPPGRKGIRQ
jgi:hypothetical protein